MKKSTKSAIIGALSVAFLFTATPVVAPQFATTAEAVLATKNPSKAFYLELNQGKMPGTFEPADGWTNGDPFDVFWHKENVTFKNGRMQLTIDKDKIGNDKNILYSGGEFRSKDFFGYGRYEVRMKALKGDGALSSFFTYTGPYDNPPTPWDEIDIEILGKDTTQVQFNYYRDSKGGHEFMYDLGFDASKDFHNYGFEWHKDCIIWFVDGKEAYRVDKEIPVTKAKIMMNAWAGKGVDEWLKPFNARNLPLVAEYEWIKFTPFENE